MDELKLFTVPWKKFERNPSSEMRNVMPLAMIPPRLPGLLAEVLLIVMLSVPGLLIGQGVGGGPPVPPQKGVPQTEVAMIRPAPAPWMMSPFPEIETPEAQVAVPADMLMVSPGEAFAMQVPTLV